MIKTIVIRPDLCISFAGILDFAQPVFGKIFNADLNQFSLDDATTVLYEAHKNCGETTDFIVASTRPEPTLLEIKNGKVQKTLTSWVGDSRAFSRFQGYMQSRLVRTRPRENTGIFGFRRVPECTGCDSALYNLLFESMKSVIEDTACPSVGGFVIPVSNHKGFFEYMDYSDVTTHPIQLDLMPPEFVVPFGTAAEGGFAINLISAREQSVQRPGVYFLQGKIGVLFLPENGLLRPHLLRGSPLEFEEMALKLYGLDARTMFTQPEYYCDRAYQKLRQGDVDAALQDADLAVERGPKIAAGYHCRAFVNSKIGKLADSLFDYSKALELDPKKRSQWNNRGSTLMQLGRLQEAIDDFSKAIELESDYLLSYRLRARALRQMGLLEAAEEDEKRGGISKKESNIATLAVFRGQHRLRGSIRIQSHAPLPEEACIEYRLTHNSKVIESARLDGPSPDIFGETLSISTVVEINPAEDELTFHVFQNSGIEIQTKTEFELIPIPA